MKNRVLIWLAKNSYRIVSFLFWGFFLFIIIINQFDKEIGRIISFSFWFLFGVYVGYSISYYSFRYLKRRQVN
ncbi:MAG: hypothetical protein WD607_02040 [Candidatus Paceibacterota bacterium]